MNPSTSVRESYGAWKADDGKIFEETLCCHCRLGAWLDAGGFEFNRSTFHRQPSGIYVERTDTSQLTVASRDFIRECSQQSSYMEHEPDFVYFNANEPDQPGPKWSTRTLSPTHRTHSPMVPWSWHRIVRFAHGVMVSFGSHVLPWCACGRVRQGWGV